MLRQVRHLGAMAVPADDCRVLAIVPIFTGERVRKLSARILGMTNADSLPDQPSEINIYGVWVDYVLWTSYLKDSGDDLTAQPGLPTSAAAIHRRMRDLLFEHDASGNEYFGGDDIQGSKRDTPEEPDDTQDSDGDGTEADRDNEPAAGAVMAPLGFDKWYSDETFFVPWGAMADQKCRHWYAADISTENSYGRGFMAIVALRYEHAAETNFSVEAADAAHIHALNRLFGGDLTRNNLILQRDAGTAGDIMRNYLFGGDNFIEADTLKGDNSKFYVKLNCTVHTPYDMIDH